MIWILVWKILSSTMRFDVLSIFPEFFSVLDLSLVKKAQTNHLIDVNVHDVRDWAYDRHRSVDDTPFGGGAGMLMKPDVWARAIDAVTHHSPTGEHMEAAHERESAEDCEYRPFTLAIPTPSGQPLTQRICEELANNQGDIVLACGRYEGIDARVAEYYRAQPGVHVLEYSLGDYVLNGGEVAAVALIEAVSRLVPGMVGNPHSLDEESYAHDGLLEYPSYTRPQVFRGLSVPDVLTSGNHQAVARWRRDRALERTARRRPDMIAALDPHKLNKKDRETLAHEGWFTSGGPLTRIDIRPALLSEAQELAQLAQRTFPDAAPRDLQEKDIQAYMKQYLQPENFYELLNDPKHHVIMVASKRSSRAYYSSSIRCDDMCDQVDSDPRLDSDPRDTTHNIGVGSNYLGNDQALCPQDHELVGYIWAVIPEGSGVAGHSEGAPENFVTSDGIKRCGPLIYLEKAYVDRPWRGAYLFRQLMHATLAHIRMMVGSYPHPYVWLGTNKENRRAQRAYRHLGFEYSGERLFYVGDQLNNDVTMALRLNMAE